jgi:hypothetical protein
MLTSVRASARCITIYIKKLKGFLMSVLYSGVPHLIPFRTEK